MMTSKIKKNLKKKKKIIPTRVWNTERERVCVRERDKKSNVILVPKIHPHINMS